MKKILVFGGWGLVGAELVRRLIEKGYGVISASRMPHESTYERVECVTNAELFTCEIDMTDVEIAVICAFSREAACDKLAGGLQFTECVLQFLKAAKIKNVINLSSQGVYAQKHTYDFIDENAEIGPIDCYGVTKYATELLTKHILDGHANFTNIRLASVNMRQRFTNYYIESVIAGRELKVNCAKQRFSLIDVSDVAEALIALLEHSDVSWEPVYNLGAGYIDTIYHAAEIIRDIGAEKYRLPKVNIGTGDAAIKLFSAVDNGKLTALTNWKPALTLQEILEKMFANIYREKNL